MVGLYMDVHIPEAITRGLRRRGVDVLTAQEDGAARLEDDELLDRATELGRALFTEDDDLLAEATSRQRSGKPFAGVVFIRQRAADIGRCIEDLELIARVNDSEDTANWVQYLPL
jgi:predicted nuclease of predicted toxin-antitoxin system